MSVAVRVMPLVVLLAACATEPQTPDAATLAAAAEPEEKVVCGKEEPTGSRLRVKRCWTQEQQKQEERDAQELVKRGQLVRPGPTDTRKR